jgi:AsmA protein
VAGLDLASSGVVDPDGGLGGRIDVTGDIASDGRTLASKGSVTATHVRLVSRGKPGAVPIGVDYDATYSLKDHRGTLRSGAVRVGRAAARLTGAYDASGRSVALRMKIQGDRLPAADLEAALPAVAMSLPAGASLRDGTLDLALTLTGPMDRLVIAGPTTLSRVTVSGFDLADRLGSLPGFGSTPKSGETLIETLGATIRIAPEGIDVDQIAVVAPAVGTLSGDGTISPANALDFRMVATLTAASVTSRLGRLLPAGGAAVIPFRVIGTAENPVFVPDAGRAAADSTRRLLTDPGSAIRAAGGLAGLFRGKKR